MYLRKQGPGPVTAADIAPPAGVEVHNPDLHIATLNSKGKLEMELTVERGRGYVSAAQNKQPGQEIGRIPIDSIYSPVMRVTYKVEATRVASGAGQCVPSHRMRQPPPRGSRAQRESSAALLARSSPLGRQVPAQRPQPPGRHLRPW